MKLFLTLLPFLWSSVGNNVAYALTCAQHEARPNVPPLSWCACSNDPTSSATPPPRIFNPTAYTQSKSAILAGLALLKTSPTPGLPGMRALDPSSLAVQNTYLDLISGDINSSANTHFPDFGATTAPTQTLDICIQNVQHIHDELLSINTNLADWDGGGDVIVGDYTIKTKNIAVNRTKALAIPHYVNGTAKISRAFKMFDGSTPPGGTFRLGSKDYYITQMRNFQAELIEIYGLLRIGGSQSVQRLTGKTMPATIPGMADSGVLADLNAIGATVPSASMGPGWKAACGIASYSDGLCLKNNSVEQILPYPNKSFTNDTCAGNQWSNAFCPGQVGTVDPTVQHIPGRRGEIVMQINRVKKTIAENIRQGMLPSTSDFVVGYESAECGKLKTEIEAIRSLIETRTQEQQTQLTKNQNAEALECTESESTDAENAKGPEFIFKAGQARLESIPGSAKIKFRGPQQAACDIDAIRVLEATLTHKYARCVLDDVSSKIIKILKNKMVSQIEAPAPLIPAMPSWLAWITVLASLLSRTHPIRRLPIFSILFIGIALLSGCKKNTKTPQNCSTVVNLCIQNCAPVHANIDKKKIELNDQIRELGAENQDGSRTERITYIRGLMTFLDTEKTRVLQVCNDQLYTQHSASADATSASRTEVCVCPGDSLVNLPDTTVEKTTDTVRVQNEQIASLYLGDTASTTTTQLAAVSDDPLMTQKLENSPAAPGPQNNSVRPLLASAAGGPGSLGGSAGAQSYGMESRGQTKTSSLSEESSNPVSALASMAQMPTPEGNQNLNYHGGSGGSVKNSAKSADTVNGYDLSSLFGTPSNSAVAVGSNVMSFGAKDESARTPAALADTFNPRASDDPADYFERSSIQDTLFERASRAIQNQSLQLSERAPSTKKRARIRMQGNGS